MSTAAPGPAPAVTKPGKCQRIVFIGSTRYLVEHKWRFDAARNKVRLETKFVNKKSPNRPSDKETRYVENTEEAVSSEALEMADRVLKKKRDVFLRENGGDAGGSSSGKKRRRNADDELADPVIVALRGGGRTRSGVETGKPDEQEAEIDWRTQDAESFLAFLNSKESSSDALEFLASKGLDAAKEVRRRIRELDVLARVGASLKRAIEQAQKQRSTSDGHRTWQTLLTAAAFMVEDEEGSQLSAQRTAAAINVRRQSFNFAVGRAKKLNPDVRPTEALKDGVYWFSPRAKRSDAASDELVSLMRQYWHTDEVSRASGNSADRDMWISSKSPNAERHPRRQLIEVGGGDAVYAKFLKWADYRSFKSRQGPEFTDPGRTLFLSTRCKCLTLPVMEQCACKIHSQQVLYIEALANVDMASHGDCSCRWCTVDGGSKWRETWKHLGTFSDAIACPKVNLRAEDPEDNVGFMGRKPECSAFKCKECGFGGAKGIPTCTRLETSQKTVEWKEFEDVITVPASADGKIKAKKLANQTIPKEGRLCDLWKAFKQDSKLYMAHHATAKWQRHCHGRCLETFQDGDLVIETDFAEKYLHQSKISMMMPVYPQTTLMIAIAHFSPKTQSGGGRVHITETWIFASEDGQHDCDFHLHGLAKMADYYLRGDGSEATAAARNDGRTPRIHMFTDGCAKQYKGKRNFRFLAESVRQIGFLVDHHFAASSHFKGTHDGLGAFAKNGLRRRERFGFRIVGADGVVTFLRGYFREKAVGEEGMRKYFATWSAYRMRKVHVELIGKTEIYRPNSTLTGIDGTREMYHFVGANTPRNDAQTTTEDPEDIKLALKREEGGRSTGEEESRLAGLGGVRVMQVSGRWKGVEGSGPVEPMSGEEVVVVRKETRVHMLRTRLASCFCSACQRFQYEDCYVNRAYPDLVPPMREGKVKETVIMDTGVALESEGKAGITFRSRQSTCEMARLTGTQWEASDSKIAFNLWKELEREEESTLLVRFRRQLGI